MQAKVAEGARMRDGTQGDSPIQGQVPGLGWIGILRLALVQAMIGAVVALSTSTLNRVMIVELSMAAMIPAGLVAWHYVVQLSRTHWGHGSDRGGRRTPWIVGGMGVLGLGTTLAADGALMSPASPVMGGALMIFAFTLIGAGVGACGTSLLALMAAEVAPKRRAAAASIAWILMIAGIVVSTIITGSLLDPFSPPRLALVATGVAAVALAVTWLATRGVERPRPAVLAANAPPARLADALQDVWSDAAARRFTIFIALSMLAYSMQDLILEPFAGLRFGYSVGDSTKLSGVQHAGALIGMIGLGVLGTVTGGHKGGALRAWTVAGCAGSALALLALAVGAQMPEGWPLKANVAVLGFCNGVFTVAAIGSMMALAGSGGPGREGIRMGLWGSAQALAFGFGGFVGAAGLDAARHAGFGDGAAFAGVFAAEALMFLAAAFVAVWIGRSSADARRVGALPNDFAAEAASR
jgi:BCD family chlorophyll transporter-like MFS transporter